MFGSDCQNLSKINGLEMDRHSPAIFVADSVGLDFLNSIATPGASQIDWIEDGDGFLNWLAQAKLVPPDALGAIEAQTAPDELDKVAGEARALREWFRGFVRKHMGRPLKAGALRELAPLSRLLERDEMFKQFVPRNDEDGDHFELRTTRRWRSPESLLLPVSEAMAKFVCEEKFEDVKACQGDGCTLMFADHTRSKERRWCSMALCGNRAKQAAHRNRRRNSG
jgi:predicted RNA-binding Zn ribbon-like protein